MLYCAVLCWAVLGASMPCNDCRQGTLTPQLPPSLSSSNPHTRRPPPAPLTLSVTRQLSGHRLTAQFHTMFYDRTKLILKQHMLLPYCCYRCRCAETMQFFAQPPHPQNKQTMYGPQCGKLENRDAGERQPPGINWQGFSTTAAVAELTDYSIPGR